MVLTVSLTEVHTVGAIFVVIPVVIVLVVAVKDAVVVVVTAMLFLASVILGSRRSGHRRWYGKGSGQKHSTENKSIAAMHVYFLQRLKNSILECRALMQYAGAIQRKMFENAHCTSWWRGRCAAACAGDEQPKGCQK
jgi:hypothetical protein